MPRRAAAFTKCSLRVLRRPDLLGLHCVAVPYTSLTHSCVEYFILRSGKLHTHGQPAECKAQLQRLGGVQGLATHLATNLQTGLALSHPHVLSERQEA